MIDLIISTVDRKLLIALAAKGRILAEEKQEELSENYSEVLQDQLKKAKINRADIERIFVVLGPGSYTGIRSGLSFAKGISHATDIKLIGVSSLDIAAYKIFKEKNFTMPFQLILEGEANFAYKKSFKSEEHFFSKRSEGDAIYLEDRSDTNKDKTYNFSQKDIAATDILNYGQEYIKKGKADSYLDITPLYLKEATITQPKR